VFTTFKLHNSATVQQTHVWQQHIKCSVLHRQTKHQGYTDFQRENHTSANVFLCLLTCVTIKLHIFNLLLSE